MLARFFKKLRQQIILLIAVAIVLLATYVSLGRQFMPAVSSYTEFFEETISDIAGVPVSIDALTGSFTGFNPVLEIRGLRFRVAGEDVLAPQTSGALFFETATLIVDVPSSIWRRQWVLEDFAVDNLEINVEQTEAGDWRLKGLNIANGAGVELASVYESFLGISRLDLDRVGINVSTRQGKRYRFNNGSASIRNQDSTHFLYVSAFPERNRAALSFSLEVSGQTLASMNGQLHVDIPVGDYSNILADQYSQQFEVLEVAGGAELWATLNNGELDSLVLEPQISRFTFKGPYSEGTSLSQVNGVAAMRLNGESTVIDLARTYVSWNGVNWLDFNGSISLEQSQNFSLALDRINVELLAGMLGESGLLNSSAQSQIAEYAPKGWLENFSVQGQLSETGLPSLTLISNVNQGQASSVSGSPNMWGIDGYVELALDGEAGLIEGLGELESENFSINIPNVFTSIWDYTYSNADLKFEVDLNDGQEVFLESSVIVAESEAVDAHGQFAVHIHRFPDGSREAELDLYVGTTRMEGAQKSLYLPDGPNVEAALRNSMEWVDGALLEGDIVNAGIAYRGSTIPGSAPETKTFQSFFEVENGSLLYSDQWPTLENLNAIVSTSDNDVDVTVMSATSMDLAMTEASGTIRRSPQGENRLLVSGIAAGSTANGLAFLQQADVSDDIKNAFDDWETEGQLTADVEVEVPLSAAGTSTEVRLEFEFEDNSIFIPEFALALNEFSGPVVFDTRSGVEETELTGKLFGEDVAVTLSSQLNKGDLNAIFVDARGAATPKALIDWPLQSGFVTNLLEEMQGRFSFNSRLILPQGDTDQPSSLSLTSNLVGASLSLPKPYAKAAEDAKELTLNLSFAESQEISGSFGSELMFEMISNEGFISSGVVYTGDASGNFENLVATEAPGLAIVGELPVFNVDEWTEFLGKLSSGAEGDDLNSSLSFVDVGVGEFELFGQSLFDVSMRVEPSETLPAWRVRLVSDSILGQVDIPFDSDSYLLVDLEYLRLPGDEDESTLMPVEGVAVLDSSDIIEEVDVLEDIDPRELPKVRFATDEFSIGSLGYGSWNFTLDPTSEGAELTDLIFDFRGLRLGLDDIEIDEESEAASLSPHFSWKFDGESHTSELEGILIADDMAQVLTENGLAAVFESNRARFDTKIQWPGSPAFFAAANLSGKIEMNIEQGRFLQDAGGNGALKLISIINFDALMRRLRFSDDLLRRGLAYDVITADLELDNGAVNIQDRLVISGPSSLYQITGDLNLADETIAGELYVTLPVSNNIPWIGLLTANIPLAVGAYLFDRIFGDQVDSLTSAVYTLEGPWDGLEPEFKQAFGSPDDLSGN